jgi:GNAT superfamily N-acetyltransferase
MGGGGGAAGASPEERPAVSVRAAGDTDWPSIWPFFREIVSAGETIAYDPEMSEMQAREMWRAGPTSRTTVAVGAGGQILGSAHMHTNKPGPGAHVPSATFLVAPAHRGRGVGRALVADALAWARASGYRAIQFNAVVETNAPALALYESMGLEVIGTVPGGFRHPVHGYVGLHIMFRGL